MFSLPHVHIKKYILDVSTNIFSKINKLKEYFLKYSKDSKYTFFQQPKKPHDISSQEKIQMYRTKIQ